MLFSISIAFSTVLLASAGQFRFGSRLERPVRYDDHALVRIAHPSADVHAFISESGDIWGGDGQSVDVLFSSKQLQDFKEAYAATVEFSILDKDVQGEIDQETTRIASPSFAAKGWFEEYHRYDEIKQWYKDLAAANPTMLRFVPSVGKSVEGRDLFAVYLTGSKASINKKKQIYFQGQIHAREWISGATVQFLAHSFLTGYGKDAEVTKILDTTEFVIVPIVNPDGYEYTWNTDRLWRKNRRNNGRANGFGVDLNRNWNSSWDQEGGASRSPFAETYKGPSVASEPETKALASFFLKHPDIVAAIDFHSYSQLILRPFGFSSVKSPHEAEHKRVGDKMKDIIFDVHSMAYTSIASVELYPTTGTASDWFYDKEVQEEFGHPVYGYTFELRPRQSFGGAGFVLAPEFIIPTGEEIFAAMKCFAAEVVANPLKLK